MLLYECKKGKWSEFMSIVKKHTNILIIIMCIVMISIGIMPVDAATKSKSQSNKFLVPVQGGWCNVNVNSTYTGTYSDKSGTRTYTKHSHTHYFSCASSSSLTSNISVAPIGYVKFYKKSGDSSITCKPTVSCKCSFYKSPQCIALRHNCAKKSIACKKDSSAYCTSTYTISSKSVTYIKNKTCKFSGLAK